MNIHLRKFSILVIILIDIIRHRAARGSHFIFIDEQKREKDNF